MIPEHDCAATRKQPRNAKEDDCLSCTGAYLVREPSELIEALVSKSLSTTAVIIPNHHDPL